MFTGKEIREPVSWILGIAAITVSLGKINNIVNPQFYTSSILIGVLTGFIIHEAAHRFVGAKYGFKTEFIAYTPGLFITFLTGFLPGIVILAPGYVKTLVYSYTPNVEKAMLNSVAAGPESNIAIGLLSFLIYHISGNPFFLGIMSVNAWMALFNLIPIPPLDGSKIIKLDRKRWGIDMLLSIILFLF